MSKNNMSPVPTLELFLGAFYLRSIFWVPSYLILYFRDLHHALTESLRNIKKKNPMIKWHLVGL